MIKLVNVKKEYKYITPLKNVNLTINDGDVISIIGPSGTGKSTLLRMINLLEKPSSGQIFIDDDEITNPNCNLPKIRQKMGMVFQSFNLFDHLTIVENIMIAQIDILNKSKQEAYDKSLELLKLVGLSDRKFSYPEDLSGGQKQRTAIARTLATDPKIILFDEPTSALDPTMVDEVQSVISSLTGLGKTMLIVTHEMKFARSISTRVLYLDDGIIYGDGTPEEIFDNPKDARIQLFVHNTNTLSVDIINKNFDFLSFSTTIKKYCNKNHLSIKTGNRLYLAFEELVQQILFNELSNPIINAILSYDEKNDLLEMNVKYNYDYFNPQESNNELSYKVLTSAVNEINYQKIDEKTYKNQLKLILKNIN